MLDALRGGAVPFDQAATATDRDAEPVARAERGRAAFTLRVPRRSFVGRRFGCHGAEWRRGIGAQAIGHAPDQMRRSEGQ
jgi:hypothetical protein